MKFHSDIVLGEALQPASVEGITGGGAARRGPALDFTGKAGLCAGEALLTAQSLQQGSTEWELNECQLNLTVKKRMNAEWTPPQNLPNCPQRVGK